MAVASYSVRWAGPETIERAQAQVLTCPVFLEGLPAVPSSGTVSLYDGSNVAQLDAVAVTITNGVASYNYTPSVNLTPAAGWRIEWALTLDGQIHIFRRDAVLVYRRLYAPDVEDALAKRHPELTRRLQSLSGICSEAWAEIESKLIAEGKRPWLILSGPAFREPMINLALSMVFRDLSEGNTNSNEWVLADKYETTYRDVWARTTFLQADEANGSTVDSNRRKSVTSLIILGGRG